jgi:uncharacterized membrane protein YphA (DoxX/SURF4 family)
MEILMETETRTTTVTHPSPAASMGLLVARIPIGAYFIKAGIGKFTMQPNGVGSFVDHHLADAMKFLPEQWARMYLGALPYIEISLGVLLIAGLLTRAAALLMSLLLISFTLGAAPHASGRFSDSVVLPFHPNLVFLGITLALMLCGPGRISIDGLLFRPRRRLVVTDEVERPVNMRPL